MNRRTVKGALMGATATVVAFVVFVFVSPSPAPAPTPTPTPVLSVAPEEGMAGYSRAKFRHWQARGFGCDVRELVLRRQGTHLVLGADCRVVSGSWLSLYDGVAVYDPAKLDVDHVVPLAEAWRSGAAGWSDARREEFANDMIRPQLVAVTAASNRSKGDQDPGKWRPPDEMYWCEYARGWIDVKRHYGLAADAGEVSALESMLASC